MIFMGNGRSMYMYGVSLIFSFIVPHCLGRSKDLDFLYKRWKPLDLVRGLRSLSVDPFDVFRSLEAVKDLDSDEALDVMHDLDVRPITIYDALDDLGVDPLDAYFGLKSWLTDPLLHPPGDFSKRVNASGDPTHPYLHVSYQKSDSKDGNPKEDYKVKYLTSEEVEKALEDIENEYKSALSEDKYKLSDFIKRSKKIHSAFDDPKKLFKDFFGKRHFREWKSLFPEAFRGLKDIYKNPLGRSISGKDKEENVSASHDKTYQHLDKGRKMGRKESDESIFVNPLGSWFGRKSGISQRGQDGFQKYEDPARYDKLQDETHVEEVGAPEKGQEGKKLIHNVKSYYDKQNNMYIECKKTEECSKSGQGMARKVQSHVRQWDPESYRRYKEQQGHPLPPHLQQQHQQQQQIYQQQNQHPQQSYQQQNQHPQQPYQQQNQHPQQPYQQQNQHPQQPCHQQNQHPQQPCQQQNQHPQQPYQQQNQYPQQTYQQQTPYNQQPQQNQYQHQQPQQPQNPSQQQSTYSHPQDNQQNQQNYQQQNPQQQQYNPNNQQQQQHWTKGTTNHHGTDQPNAF